MSSAYRCFHCQQNVSEGASHSHSESSVTFTPTNTPLLEYLLNQQKTAEKHEGHNYEQ